MEADWRIKLKKVVERNKHLFKSKEFSDCSFMVVDPESGIRILIEAHKYVLASGSPVFAAMLYGTLQETVMPVAIPDMEPHIFNSLLEYMYTDKANLQTVDDTLALWCAADMYQVSNLTEICVKRLMVDLEPENLLKVLDYARTIPNIELLQRCVLLMETCDVDSLLLSPDFENTSIETLLMIVSSNFLKVSSEVEVFSAVERWAITECKRQSLSVNTENLKKVSNGVYQKIRFLIMTPQQFTKGPALSPLLTREESFAIIMHILQPDIAKANVPLAPELAVTPLRRVTSSGIRQPPLPVRFCSSSENFMKVQIVHKGREDVEINKKTCFSLSFVSSNTMALGGLDFPNTAPSSTNAAVTPSFTVELLNCRGKRLLQFHRNHWVEPTSDMLICEFPNGPIYIHRHLKYTLRIFVETPALYKICKLKDTKEINRKVNSCTFLKFSDFETEVIFSNLYVLC